MIDGQGTVFTFDGTAVGGIEAYEFFTGDAEESTFALLSGEGTVARPGSPDPGNCMVKLYYDPTDPGQVKMLNSLRLREVVDCLITYKDGSTKPFDGFVTKFPSAGTKSAGQPAITSSVIIRCANPIQ